MIRKACFALCATAALASAQSTGAAVSLSARISQVVNALQDNTHFSPRNFSFTLNGTGSAAGTLFVGLEGVRALNGGDIYRVNQWLDQTPVPAPTTYGGGTYSFTHGGLGSFFNNQPQGSGGNGSGAPYGGGAPYQFTHSALGSYFGSGQPSGSSADDNAQGSAPAFDETTLAEDLLEGSFDEEEQNGAYRIMLSEAPEQLSFAQISAPVPEPASWAMMIGGFALVGTAMRNRRAAILGA